MGECEESFIKTIDEPGPLISPLSASKTLRRFPLKTIGVFPVYNEFVLISRPFYVDNLTEIVILARKRK